MTIYTAPKARKPHIHKTNPRHPILLTLGTFLPSLSSDETHVGPR